ncbi:hypothetical protein A2853_03315 [Candidatus Kaiserbacteria bacterium RIFCSPHIGHO2_01_FULL_55_17]|uniref:LTD domain-containing protein n=1 Tax=Candidatus Kaiserbacteria bacterium RIFCSPHIGHO2_01_FULL_55_17 TaxID=1798484 RepID=A0A1F6D9B3_9BACT|nr:MAG: hypothetical protein A2853_03315 [Candidatus Kaiserbacteria bacterium RIFCSPHIGHO2_01_FULL_55_17]
MLLKILIGFAIATLVILLFLWLATGGLSEVRNTASGISNPFTRLFGGGFGAFRLPWQPEELVHGPTISGMDGLGGEKTPEEELADSQKEYDALLQEIQNAKTFGEPSPYRGKVTISQGDSTAQSPSAEYVELRTTWDNTAPVRISGWSLQSALTGLRAHIPRGTSAFVLGAVNTQEDIYLGPDTSAIVTTGVSPVGTSFRENVCTGYLDELQTFVPTLSRSCPSPSDSLPLTPENINTYGDTCFDFVRTLPSCTFPIETPASISPACRIFLSNNLSYNGCVQNYRYKSDFARGSWRIYLNSGGELWRNSHDIIRLLDAEGKTVDVMSY